MLKNVPRNDAILHVYQINFNTAHTCVFLELSFIFIATFDYKYIFYDKNLYGTLIRTWEQVIKVKFSHTEKRKPQKQRGLET